jgi:sugar phosphate isomerase/epimerase
VTPGRRLRWPEVVWSHFSRPRFDDFDARARAAAAAGFHGIGLYTEAFGRMRADGRTAADVAAVVSSLGLTIAETEVARGWWAADGPAAEQSARIERWAFELADACGVRYLQAIGPYDCSLTQAIDGFGALCDRAAAHDMLVGIEWLPYTNIANADDAQTIVESVGRRNAGYCVDIWHHIRGANDIDMIRRLPAERVFAVQMNDGTLRPALDDYKEDCLANRLAPGDGEFGCAEFLRELRAMGVEAPLSLEVCSAELWNAPVEHAANVAAAAMRKVLREVN